MKRLAILVLALALFGSNAAWSQQIDRVEITEYGIYTAKITKVEHGADGLAHNTVGSIRHASTTTTVRAELGVHFGFRYRVVGAPAGQSVRLTKVTVYPPPGARPPGSAGPVKHADDPITATTGGTSYTDYSFDDPWELIPGTWLMQIWSGNRMLAEKRFTVTAP